MKRRTLGVVIVAAAVAGLVAWSATRSKPVLVTLTPVERGEVRWTASNTRAGTVEACNRARMAPILGGQISALPVEEGDRVEAGQILMELWNADVRANVHLAEQERRAAAASADEACTAAEVANRVLQQARCSSLSRSHSEYFTSVACPAEYPAWSSLRSMARYSVGFVF